MDLTNSLPRVYGLTHTDFKIIAQKSSGKTGANCDDNSQDFSTTRVSNHGARNSTLYFAIILLRTVLHGDPEIRTTNTFRIQIANF